MAEGDKVYIADKETLDAVNTNVSSVKTTVGTINTNVSTVKTNTSVIGATTDSAGTATTGTVMAKLNKLIGSPTSVIKSVQRGWCDEEITVSTSESLPYLYLTISSVDTSKSVVFFTLAPTNAKKSTTELRRAGGGCLYDSTTLKINPTEYYLSSDTDYRNIRYAVYWQVIEFV